MKRAGILLFLSGACALTYQVVWLRELRLVFGTSTAASAAVLAIFMGGLGLGAAYLGKRADRSRRPLLLFSNIEMLISYSAALSPFLIMVSRLFYYRLGGTAVLGPMAATWIRLLLSVLVLGFPAFLMGGTLPAMARAVLSPADRNRRSFAYLYGINTMGGVGGAVLATFFTIESLGLRYSIWSASFVNLVVAAAARVMVYRAGNGTVSRTTAEIPGGAQTEAGPQTGKTGFLLGFLLSASFVSGFGFFLMELVWYRMLSPILGGTTYTFGLILTLALLGIACGGALYSFQDRTDRIGIRTLAAVFGLETFFLMIPYALGDRMAVFAALLHPLSAAGFPGKVIGWTLVAGLVVIPASVVAGFLFPLIVGLLGSGTREIGKDTGLAYACNTAGAIVGSLAGGFFLLPAWSAPGAWKAVALTWAFLGVIALVLSHRERSEASSWCLPAGAILAGLAMIFAQGPTAAWRHSAIGAGRAALTVRGPNEIRNWIHDKRRSILWEAEGVESSIGINGKDGLSFHVNGASDGNAYLDASTAIGLGMISGILHPEPKKAMVVGLGTGSTAGWIADIDTMERVDVVELEPAVMEIARRCSPVNRGVLDNRKARVIIGDAREWLFTVPEKYDLIISEPSNPYRAGIASLYTLEFYRSAARRLADGGMFSQWVQGYEVDTRTIRMVYATLASVFPVVETWQTNPTDILFLCSMEKIPYPVPVLKERLSREPFSTAFQSVWGITDLEGFLAHYVAQSSIAQRVSFQEIKKDAINTDDRMPVEFAFARSLGREWPFSLEDVRREAILQQAHRPEIHDGAVDWDKVEENYFILCAMANGRVPRLVQLSPEQQVRSLAYIHFWNDNLKETLTTWNLQSRKPVYPFEKAMVAEALAELGDSESLPLIEQLRPHRPVEALSILARYLWRSEKREKALYAMGNAIVEARKNPWFFRISMIHALKFCVEMARNDQAMAEKLFEWLSTPFSVNILNDFRLQTMIDISTGLERKYGVRVIRQFEPHVPWNAEFLTYRLKCYQETWDSRAYEAENDLRSFAEDASISFGNSFQEDGR